MKFQSIIMNRYFYIIAILLLFNFCSASAADLSQTVNNLQILPVNYGANNITVNHKKLLIIKARLATGTAWEQDNYIVMQQQGETWQAAHNEINGKDDIIFRAVPHTGEDSISSVYFMTPKNSKRDVADLYMLQVSRQYKESPQESVPARLSLMILNHENDELGVLEFKEIANAVSKAKYCNSDSAAHHELGIKFSEDFEDPKCLEK